MISHPARQWHTLVEDRDEFLWRARQCASLTIPSLFPPSEGAHGNLPVPFQSTGAEGVRNLASSLVLTLLPMDQPFFRLDPGVDVTQLEPSVKQALEADLSAIEQGAQKRLEEMRIRTKVNEALQYTIVGGGSVIDFRKDTPRVHRFHNYCIQRDGRGNIAMLMVRERPSVEELFERFGAESQDEAMAKLRKELGDEGQYAKAALYTVLERTREGTYKSYQIVCGSETERTKEGDGELVPGSEVEYTSKTPVPWVVIGFKRLDGEDYPRSFCDELLGALDNLNESSQAFQELESAAARSNPMFDPTGMTEIDDFVNAQNLEPIAGREEDVYWAGMDKQAAVLAASMASIEKKEANIQRQFLMFLGARRQGERVTAEEIQLTAMELEKGLGGAYSMLADQLQKPLVQIVLHGMRKDRRYKDIFKGLEDSGLDIQIKVTAGLDILSRGQELQRFIFALQTAATVLPPEQTSQYIKVGDTLRHIFTQIGLNPSGLIRTEEEVQQIQAQQAQQDALVSSAPQLVKTAAEQQQIQ